MDCTNEKKHTYKCKDILELMLLLLSEVNFSGLLES